MRRDVTLNNGAAEQQHRSSHQTNKRGARAGKSSGAGKRHNRKHKRKQKRGELWNAMWKTQQQIDRIQAVQVCGGRERGRELFSKQGKNAQATGKQQKRAMPLALLGFASDRNRQAQQSSEQGKYHQVGAEEHHGFIPTIPVRVALSEVTGVSADRLRMAGQQCDQAKVGDRRPDTNTQANPEAALGLHYLSLQAGDLLAP